MTVWGSQAFIKTLLFLPFICVEYFLKCHLNVTEIYQQYTWIKTDGILITAFSKPSQGFTGSHVMFVISLEFDHACHRELIPCCTYFRSSSKLTFSNWNEKPSAKSKFLQWNSGTCFFFFFFVVSLSWPQRSLLSVHQCMLQECLHGDFCIFFSVLDWKQD